MKATVDKGTSLLFACLFNITNYHFIYTYDFLSIKDKQEKNLHISYCSFWHKLFVQH